MRNSIHDNDNGLYLGSPVGSDFDFSGGSGGAPFDVSGQASTVATACAAGRVK